MYGLKDVYGRWVSVGHGMTRDMGRVMKFATKKEANEYRKSRTLVEFRPKFIKETYDGTDKNGASGDSNKE